MHVLIGGLYIHMYMTTPLVITLYTTKSGNVLIRQKCVYGMDKISKTQGGSFVALSGPGVYMYDCR